MRVYPNPWRADKHAGVPITFKAEQSTPNFTVDILSNFSGRHVRTLAATDGHVAWDLTSDTGSPTGSGSYIYIVKFSGNNSAKGRLAIIR